MLIVLRFVLFGFDPPDDDVDVWNVDVAAGGDDDDAVICCVEVVAVVIADGDDPC